MKPPHLGCRDIANLNLEDIQNMTDPKDPRPLDPPSYWEDEQDGPTCRLCGVELHTPNEERHGLCDACYEAEQQEEEDQPTEDKAQTMRDLYSGKIPLEEWRKP